MMALAEGGPQSQSRLVGLERLDHSTIAHSLRRMETAALVSRKPCGDDRRVTIVSLTPKGRTLYKRILRVWEELERASAANLDDGEEHHQQCRSRRAAQEGSGSEAQASSRAPSRRPVICCAARRLRKRLCTCSGTRTT
jgi:MarR family transcriptional regulator, organic hydroperoxide resistance regulator